jgi:hypothetical protein
MTLSISACMMTTAKMLLVIRDGVQGDFTE